MNSLKKILAVTLLLVFALAGCQSAAYNQSVEIGAEYPVEMFPIYTDAIVYMYEFDEGVIDITFGTDDTYEKVSKYYDLLFEHSKYDVTAQKMTNQSYISSGKTNHYKYLMEVNKAIFRKEKRLYNTIVNVRISINGFVVDNVNLPMETTPTPQQVEKITPAPTNTIAPTTTPAPTEEPNTYFNMEVISTVDMADEQIFIECLDVTQSAKDDSQKTISVLLKMINYSKEETGYITTSDFSLIDENGIAYHSDMVDGIFASGVNILPGGYCIDYISFVVGSDVIVSVLAMPEGLGSRLTGSYDLELAPLAPPMNAGLYDGAVGGIADISHIPTFIIGQEYTIDESLTTKLINAQYFTNHSSINQENLMYTFNMEFINISSTVIIPTEIRDFVLYDIKHNIMVKPTVDLTPYDELAFNPVQNGLSENYHISFEVFEETSENYLCLALLRVNQQDNAIIYKIR